MPRTALVSCTAVALAVLLAGCESSTPSAPLTTGEVAFVKGSSSQAIGFRVRDDCEPESFNAAVGPDTCVGDGGTTFEEFIEELWDEQDVGAWRFQPEAAEVHAHTTLMIENRGGEVHTVTQVAQFGGGFVADLNGLSGTPDPAPECAQMMEDGLLAPQPPSATNVFVGADGEATFEMPSSGTVKLQCCIHPWMVSTLKVKS